MTSPGIELRVSSPSFYSATTFITRFGPLGVCRLVGLLVPKTKRGLCTKPMNCTNLFNWYVMKPIVVPQTKRSHFLRPRERRPNPSVPKHMNFITDLMSGPVPWNFPEEQRRKQTGRYACTRTSTAEHGAAFACSRLLHTRGTLARAACARCLSANDSRFSLPETDEGPGGVEYGACGFAHPQTHRGARLSHFPARE